MHYNLDLVYGIINFGCGVENRILVGICIIENKTSMHVVLLEKHDS